jgi:hypothetical protein
MSAAQPSRRAPDHARVAPRRPQRHLAPARDRTAERRIRHREERRRRHLVRVDVGTGVLGGIVVLLATPGLAIAGLVAVALIVLCVASIVRERRSRR